ncbi:transposase family protein [Cerasicoccus maritimus]|uniref:transposase family protein n=1 Tax=Cerasicoccus maritimus TaxID=490089 RepID=UPI003CCCE4F0
MTDRLVRYVKAICRILPIKHIAERLDLSWHTVTGIQNTSSFRLNMHSPVNDDEPKKRRPSIGTAFSKC